MMNGWNIIIIRYKLGIYKGQKKKTGKIIPFLVDKEEQKAKVTANICNIISIKMYQQWYCSINSINI